MATSVKKVRVARDAELTLKVEEQGESIAITGWVPAARPFGDWRANPSIAHPSVSEIEEAVGKTLGYEVGMLSWGYSADEELIFRFRVA